MAIICDVAAYTDVSSKTINCIINGDTAVSDVTREKAGTTIVAPGYISSSAVRIMRSNRSRPIGLTTGATSRTNEVFRVYDLSDMLLVKGIQRQMCAAGRTLVIVDTANRADQIESLIRTFTEHRTGGILYVTEYHRGVALPEVTSTCPIVLINCFDASGAPSVPPDDEQGQCGLVRQIIRHDHIRIAYATLPSGMETTRLRIQGYRHALEGAGIAFNLKLLQTGYSDYSNDSKPLSVAVPRPMTLPQPPSVICYGNDEMTVCVYDILRTRGLRAPERVPAANYDNHSAVAEALFPPLTNAELPYMHMGTPAADMLLGIVDDKKETGHIARVAGETIWRRSVISLG